MANRRHDRSLSNTGFPLHDNRQPLNSNPFPLCCNGFPLNATSIPDSDSRFPLNDNRFPHNDNVFPDNGNDRRAEFPVPGPLDPANGEEFADRKGRDFSSN